MSEGSTTECDYSISSESEASEEQEKKIIIEPKQVAKNVRSSNKK